MCQVYRSTAKKGFWLAGLYNWVTILGLNQFFTSNVLTETDPIVFSWMGQVLILLWGAVYFWRAPRFNQAPLLTSIFAITKFIYFIAWLYWLLNFPEKLDALAGQSMWLFCFFAGYGYIEIMFAVFFILVYLNKFKVHYL